MSDAQTFTIYSLQASARRDRAGAEVTRVRGVRENDGLARRSTNEDPRHPVRFQLGRLFATPGVLAVLGDRQEAGKPSSIQRASESADPMLLVLPFIGRHLSGDWGDLDAEDRAANEVALTIGERVLSAYALHGGERIWVITEADRSSTTVLLPSEY